MTFLPTVASLKGIQAACIPADEAERLETLRSLCLLDSAPSASFDRATRLAANLLRVPIVLISLVDENRQWFKSKIGLSAVETSREVSFCAHAVFHREPLLVADATRDARFAANPLVTGAPYIRAYLGIPILSREGHAIGTLCAIDTQVHAFTNEDVQNLIDCTKVLEDLIHSMELAQGKDDILRLATEREQRFQCLVQLTSQIIWTNNADGRMVGEQPGWRSFTGQTFEEYQGSGWTAAVHPEDAQPTIDEWNRCVAEKCPFIFEHRVRRHDGMYRICSIDAAPVLNEDGTIREWVGVHHDITERRQQEEEIRAQEAHFRFLADAVPQMVWTARPDGFADYYNQQWYAYTGMTREQAERGEWAPVHPDDIQNSMRVWSHSVDTGVPYQVEHRFKRSTDGSYRWHLCRAVRLMDEEGGTVKWFGTCTDIHDYKEAEARNLELQEDLENRVRERTAALETANKDLTLFSGKLERSNQSLKASEEFFDRAGQIAGIGAWSFDLETQAIRWSDRTCLIHEVDIGHVPILAEAVNFYTPESRVVLEHAMQQCIEIGTAYDLELTVVTAKCRTIWVRVAGEVEMSQGKAVRMFGVFQDITARKQVDRMKSDFIASVSHELRTPLTSIRGSLGLINGGAAGLLPDNVARLIEIAYQNTSRLTHIINDILDVEKLDSGKMSMELQYLELAPLIEQAAEQNAGYAATHKVKYVVKVPLPELTVLGDPGRLLQVLANLLSNAAKFSPEGAVVEIAICHDRGRARISVTDHGPGVDEDFQARLFQKFSQADGSDTRAKGGTGLGLAIAKALIEQMGGTIGFSTARGIGTTFYFELPASVRAAVG